MLKLNTIQCTEEVPTTELATGLGNGYACLSEKWERVCVSLCGWGEEVTGGGGGGKETKCLPELPQYKYRIMN